jgi:hypothetical protein
MLLMFHHNQRRKRDEDAEDTIDTVVEDVVVEKYKKARKTSSNSKRKNGKSDTDIQSQGGDEQQVVATGADNQPKGTAEVVPKRRSERSTHGKGGVVARNDKIFDEITREEPRKRRAGTAETVDKARLAQSV